MHFSMKLVIDWELLPWSGRQRPRIVNLASQLHRNWYRLQSNCVRLSCGLTCPWLRRFVKKVPSVCIRHDLLMVLMHSCIGKPLGVPSKAQCTYEGQSLTFQSAIGSSTIDVSQFPVHDRPKLFAMFARRIAPERFEVVTSLGLRHDLMAHNGGEAKRESLQNANPAYFDVLLSG
jgi:hypothetical protein